MQKPVKLSKGTLLFVLGHLDQGGHIRWETIGVGNRRVRKLTIFGTDFPLMYTILSRAFDILSTKQMIACTDKHDPMTRSYFITALGKQAVKAGAI